jgi:hypothetical protein
MIHARISEREDLRRTQVRATGRLQWGSTNCVPCDIVDGSVGRLLERSVRLPEGLQAAAGTVQIWCPKFVSAGRSTFLYTQEARKA